MFGVMCFARATDTNIHTNTLRGLKIYLLFNRLVRRYVMSVNVNVSGGMYVKECAFFDIHTTTNININTHNIPPY